MSTAEIPLPPMHTAEEAAQWLREQITRRTHLIADCEAIRNENEKRFQQQKVGVSPERAQSIHARWKEANGRTAQNIARHDEIRSAYRTMLQWLTGEVWG